MNAADVVLLLGDVNIDVLMSLDCYPALGEEGLARHTVVRAGGGVANSASVLTRMGIKSRLLGRAGWDPLGDFALSEYKKAGIDISCISRDSQDTTGLTLISVIPGGERTMFSSRGANCNHVVEDVTKASFQDAKLLQLTGYAFLERPQRDAAWQAVALARESNIPISLDTTLAPVLKSKEHFSRLVGQLDICILGMEEARALFEAESPESAIRAMLAQGITIAAVKLGKRGALFGLEKSSFSLPAFEVESVDATGAGDAFSAGLIFGRLHHLSLQSCGILACALGALATTVWGGGPSLPGGRELASFLKDTLLKGNYQHLESSLRETLTAVETALVQEAAPENGR